MSTDSLLTGPSRLVGVDVGTKRVGLAMSDPLRLFAQPHGTYAPEDALDELVQLAEDDGLDAIVVGWPLTEDGEEEEAVEMVRAFVERIEATLPHVSVARCDERFTSERAKDLLRRAGVSQPGRYDKGRVDAAAAAVILQDYLGRTGG
jgi:putative Holliday junction resolvase